ncbi:MAG TPA: class I SAM-dependent methyltransferase [Marmoricola sp.]|nr:class I SAM-dependent methyltransferase [Marmoricola sp.]
MDGYALAYRLGLTPWERYGGAAGESIRTRLDREAAERPQPPGRALDLGCGRGQYTDELTRRGWAVVGIDRVPGAVDAARRRGIPGAGFVVGDVTDLVAADLGSFDFFFDVGCFQGLDPAQRRAAGRGISQLANPGATLLMLAFGVTRLRPLAGGVSRAEVEEAFPGWELLSAEPGDTAGLGWPMSRMSPTWYRLRRVSTPDVRS